MVEALYQLQVEYSRCGIAEFIHLQDLALLQLSCSCSQNNVYFIVAGGGGSGGRRRRRWWWWGFRETNSVHLIPAFRCHQMP